VARERVEDKNRDSDAGEPETDTGEPETDAGARAAWGGAGKPGSRLSGDSGTAAAAAQARAVMQRRHRRIGFAMTAAVGVEAAGGAGLVLAGLLPWEWGERLWGRTDTGGLVLQVAIAATVLGLALGWLPARSARADRRRQHSRTATLLPAAAVVVGGVAMVWQAAPGSRGAGPVVAGLAAVLVLAGAVGWLAGLRKLRVLFPFGLQDARAVGFGNLPAVRRATLVGGPVGAVGGIVVVAGALLVVPGVVTTEDSQTAGALVLSGSPPAAGDQGWDLTVTGDSSASIRAAAGGLVVEERQGVRVVDPRDGSARWHWRDGAYQRVATVVTDQGETVVVGLQYEGDQRERDRVVALDSGTGEVRWDRYDQELVAAMSLVVVAPRAGNWFVVPVPGPASPEGQPAAPVALRAVDSSGDTRWRGGEVEGCNLTSASADAGSVVVIGQECTDPDTGVGGCRVTALDPVTGGESWSWPTGEPVTGCQTTPRPELVFVSYRTEAGTAAVALDPATGAEVWTVTGEEATSLTGAVVVGDAVLGPEPTGDGAVLVVREAADGEVRQEITLPAGQPIEMVPARDGFAAIAHYRPESAEVLLLEVDVAAGSVSSETMIATSPSGATFQRVGLAVGPETLAMDALLATGPEPGPDDYTLLVHGFG
jgi:outer membrane protein assembly factor BamB